MNPMGSEKHYNSVVELLPQERTNLLLTESMTVSTLFEGKVPEEFIEARLKEIVSVNPWVRSRLVTNPESGQPGLSYPHDDFTPGELFKSVHLSELGMDGGGFETMIKQSSSRFITKQQQGLYVRQGIHCIDKDESLIKITVCEGDKHNFILIVSMSHVLGDAATFYQLYGMLSPESEVKFLESKRCFEVVDNLSHLPDEIRGFSCDNRKRLAHVFKDMKLNKRQCLINGFRIKEESQYDEQPDHHKSGFFRINKAWVDQEKQAVLAHSDGSAYVSTNDILTSWFMKTSEAHCGLLAVNLRGRDLRLKDNQVGNYVLASILYPDEFASARNVRQFVDSLDSYHLSDSQESTPSNRVLITNWTQYYVDLDLGPECRLLEHRPVFPYGFGSGLRWSSIMFIYCLREGALGAFIDSECFSRFEKEIGGILSPL
ncbi:hypothetical protein [Dongshaea marina]|uniref:hypothetical protein n=1 Tax=Dongshaea marina TaxID=2047966 RepID=UPI000D3EAADE|nr:hypothetical protein [Dongshaea marina]